MPEQSSKNREVCQGNSPMFCGKRNHEQGYEIMCGIL